MQYASEDSNESKDCNASKDSNAGKDTNASTTGKDGYLFRNDCYSNVGNVVKDVKSSNVGNNYINAVKDIE